MLKRLHLRNFTVFADAEFNFGDGLNVLVGTNGTGKTHVLKAGYSIEIAKASANKTIKATASAGISDTEMRDTTAWVISISQVLKEVFLVEQVGRLINRNSKKTAEVEVEFSLPKEKVSFQIRPRNEGSGRASSVAVNSRRIPLPQIKETPPFIFIPAKEVLTLGWLPFVYDRYSKDEIRIDRTYPDVIRLLMGPSLKEPKPAYIVENISLLIGGKVETQGDRFYIELPDQLPIEMNLVAEGMRKFATLYKLLANGTLTPETTLFWDEPEANLNPALLKELAVVLTDLAQAGFQIILATHSLFLMKELHILSRQRKQPVRYFGLYTGEKGDVQVEKQDDFMQLQHIAALDAELAQTFDFDEVLDQDYAGDS